MNRRKSQQEGGFVGIIVLVLIALVAAKYFFDWSIFDWMSTEKGKAALAYLVDLLRSLKDLVLALWAYIH